MDSSLETFVGRVVRNSRQLARFSLVGASGVIVNLAALTAVVSIGVANDQVLVDLPATDFNARAYHLYVTGAFLVANVWNYQLNRWFTFDTTRRGSWLHAYVSFLGVGLVSLVLNLALVTVFLHAHSPVNIELVVGSSNSDIALQVANVVAIVLVTPVNFVLTKVLAFRDFGRRQAITPARKAAEA